jgi:AraC-like DNA-binding protein
MSSFNFTVYDAPDVLKRDVLCVRAIKHHGPGASDAKITPSAFPGIVFHNKAGESAIEKITTKHFEVDDLPLFFLHGLGSEPSTMHFSAGDFTIFQVVLKPQAPYALFGLGSASLKQGILLADEIQATELLTNLLSIDSEVESANLLFRFLINRLGDNGQRDLLVERSLDYINQNVGAVTVSDICSTLNISERILQRRFADVIGMSAQTYIRVKRVNEAIRLMKSGNYDRLIDVATALNFYDQSHFIKDVKALSWLSPTSLKQKIEDFQLDQTGFSYS